VKSIVRGRTAEKHCFGMEPEHFPQVIISMKAGHLLPPPFPTTGEPPEHCLAHCRLSINIYLGNGQIWFLRK
jgi:hypothetical protein